MTTTTSIEPLLERLLAGERLSAADQTTLCDSRDLLTLGMAADQLRRRRHGAQVTFVRVAVVSLDQALAGGASWDGAPGEIRIVGVPADLDQAVRAVAAVTASARGVPVTAFSLDDLERAVGEGVSPGTWLEPLKRAGLAAVADAPVDRVQSPRTWFRALEDVGLPLARLTVDRAPEVDRLALVARVASLVQEFTGIEVFAPLPRKATGLGPSTGYDDVHLVALTRLLVPVSHVQVDWQRYGPKLAQVALTFGADDVDGVSPQDELTQGRRRSPLEEIRRNILAASGEPVERGALFPRRG
jgi:aminodeoxyfutalosine synthase